MKTLFWWRKFIFQIKISKLITEELFSSSLAKTVKWRIFSNLEVDSLLYYFNVFSIFLEIKKYLTSQFFWSICKERICITAYILEIYWWSNLFLLPVKYFLKSIWVLLISWRVKLSSVYMSKFSCNEYLKMWGINRRSFLHSNYISVYFSSVPTLTELLLWKILKCLSDVTITTRTSTIHLIVIDIHWMLTLHKQLF